MRLRMPLKRILLNAVITLLFLFASYAFAAEDVEIDLSLYPPLSSGEASPWQESTPAPVPVRPDSDRQWGAATGVPMRPINPYYRYQNQAQARYYYPPQQSYGYMPPAYGYAQNYPPMPYGNYGRSMNSQPFGGMPFNGVMPFRSGGFSPFGFSMPWPF